MTRANNKIAHLLRAAQLALLSTILLGAGCATPWIESFDYEKSLLSQIENFDGPSGTLADHKDQGAGENGSRSGIPNLSSTLAAEKESVDDPITRRLPTIQFQVSTPSDYLRGQRDDYEQVWQGTVYSEVGFNLTSEESDALYVANGKSTQLGSKPINESYGLQLGVSHRLPTFSRGGDSVNKSRFNLSYGARYLQLDDAFFFSASSPLFGNLSSSTYLENDLLGPQVSLDWSKRKYGCDFSLNSSLMLGYNFVTASQLSKYQSPHAYAVGAGGLNRIRIAQPVVWGVEQDREEFTSVAEIRALVSYPIARNLDLRLSYTGIYLSDLQRAQAAVYWSIPNSGFYRSPARDLWADKIFASIEWRL